MERNTDADLNFDKDEIRRMREMARKLSQKIEQDKLSKFMNSSKTGSDSDSKNKTVDATNTAGSSSKEGCSKDTSQGNTSTSTGSSVYEPGFLSDRDKLKQFKIKKKPSSELLNVAGSSVSDLAERSRDPGNDCESRKEDTSKRKSDKKDRLTGEPVEKRSKNREELKQDKHKKKKHKKKDASTLVEKLS